MASMVPNNDFALNPRQDNKTMAEKHGTMRLRSWRADDAQPNNVMRWTVVIYSTNVNFPTSGVHKTKIKLAKTSGNLFKCGEEL